MDIHTMISFFLPTIPWLLVALRLWGYGLLAAIGLKVAGPDKLVIGIDGSASFGIPLTDLSIAVQLNIGLRSFPWTITDWEWLRKRWIYSMNIDTHMPTNRTLVSCRWQTQCIFNIGRSINRLMLSMPTP